MNKNEKKNILNYLSIADELYLEKMFKTEKQINEILEQIENINDTLDDIQQRMDESPESMDSLNKKNIQQKVEDISDTLTSIYKEYPQNNLNDKGTYNIPLQDTEAKFKHKKENDYQENKKAKSFKKKLSWLGETVFYLVMVIMVLGAFLLRSNNSGRPTSIAGYSLFTVLTGSMESEIPQGSLVVVKEVDTETLQIGDDITFMANQNTTVTHRIIAIIESYQDTGERAFETQGVMNKNPDKNLVPATNVIGKVVYHNKLIGEIGTFVGQNWPFLIFAVVVVFVLSKFLRSIYGKKQEDTE